MNLKEKLLAAIESGKKFGLENTILVVASRDGKLGVNAMKITEVGDDYFVSEGPKDKDFKGYVQPFSMLPVFTEEMDLENATKIKALNSGLILGKV